MPLGEAGGKTDIVYIGTILHYDSVLSRTLDNPMWKTARFKAVIQWPANMKLWDEWEELIRNKQGEAAEVFYMNNVFEMLAGSAVSLVSGYLAALAARKIQYGKIGRCGCDFCRLIVSVFSRQKTLNLQLLKEFFNGNNGFGNMEGDIKGIKQN